MVDPRTGATVGEQVDEGLALSARCWSPVPGDQRLALGHEREGDERPAIWDLATGERTDLAIDGEGAVSAADWWPDGSALLLVNRFEGRDRLLRYELATGELTRDRDRARERARRRPSGRTAGLVLHEQGHQAA